MVLADREGWDRYEAAKWLTLRSWLDNYPDDDFVQAKAELNIGLARQVTWICEYIGWDVFAFIVR